MLPPEQKRNDKNVAEVHSVFSLTGVLGSPSNGVPSLTGKRLSGIGKADRHVILRVRIHRGLQRTKRERERMDEGEMLCQ